MAKPVKLTLLRIYFLLAFLDGLAALGCIVNEIPMVAHLERDPFEAIATGDHLVVDADRGLLRVTPKSTLDHE